MFLRFSFSQFFTSLLRLLLIQTCSVETRLVLRDKISLTHVWCARLERWGQLFASIYKVCRLCLGKGLSLMLWKTSACHFSHRFSSFRWINQCGDRLHGKKLSITVYIVLGISREMRRWVFEDKLFLSDLLLWYSSSSFSKAKNVRIGFSSRQNERI